MRSAASLAFDILPLQSLSSFASSLSPSPSIAVGETLKRGGGGTGACSACARTPAMPASCPVADRMAIWTSLSEYSAPATLSFAVVGDASSSFASPPVTVCATPATTFTRVPVSISTGTRPNAPLTSPMMDQTFFIATSSPPFSKSAISATFVTVRAANSSSLAASATFAAAVCKPAWAVAAVASATRHS
ncbi:hypothetical protein F4823DRAFT_575621 [Ustulina deusta]|nr:hypothetical protein F4823DRAFT_575621 [Ustulina deusta]